MKVNKYNEDETNIKFSFQNIKRGFKYTKGNYKKLIIILMISIISTILMLLIVPIFSYVLDEVLPNGNLNQLYLMGIILIVILIVYHILEYFNTKLTVKVRQKMIVEIKDELFAHMQYLSYDFFNSRPSGKILVRLTDYAANIASFITHHLLSTFVDLLRVIFVIIFMLNTNVPLTFVVLSGVLILIVIYRFVTPRRRKLRQNLNNKWSNLNAFQLESVKGVQTVQSFNREEKNRDILDDLNMDFIKSLKPAAYLGNLNWSSTEIISQLVLAMILIVGTNVLFPNITLGIIVAMITYSNRFYSPIRRFFKTLDQSIDVTTYVERVFELLDEPIVIKDHENSQEITMSGAIEFKDVSFSYIDNHPVLTNINFEVKAGEKVAIVGETGSGKTTIINLMARFYDKDRGSILFDGVDVADIKISSLRKNINVMLQDNFLFTMSILENLRISNPFMDEKEVIKIMKQMNLHDFIMSFENGYDTILDNGGSNLSQGQKQLLCYARAIIEDPHILILDEATSKIDTLTEKLLNESLNTLLENRTVIMIAHRLSTIVHCDKIMLIKDHQIHESGTHQELMKKRGEYYKLYTSQL